MQSTLGAMLDLSAARVPDVGPLRNKRRATASHLATLVRLAPTCLTCDMSSSVCAILNILLVFLLTLVIKQTRRGEGWWPRGVFFFLDGNDDCVDDWVSERVSLNGPHTRRNDGRANARLRERFSIVTSEVDLGLNRLKNVGSADGALWLDFCRKIDALLVKAVHALQCLDADLAQ